VIVTTFTAGQQTTLPIWMLSELVRPRQRPVTNVVAVFVIAVTFLPILAAYYLTRGTETVGGRGNENTLQGSDDPHAHRDADRIATSSNGTERRRRSSTRDRRFDPQAAGGLGRADRQGGGGRRERPSDVVADHAGGALRLLLKLADAIEAEAEAFAGSRR
jgi:hypothetical protein